MTKTANQQDWSHRGWRSPLAIATFGLVALASPAGRGVTAQERFDTGQDVVPVYEGWMRNPDGSYQFHFGYLNRNWVEQPEIPIGENNSFSPGPHDRGQPAFFYPRRNLFTFSVTVPKDWGPKQELVWTLTVHGRTEHAYGWLQSEWEVDSLTVAENARTRYGRSSEEIAANHPPSITIDPVASASVSRPLTLTATIADDGLPALKPKRPSRPGLATLSTPPTPTNLPTYRQPLPPQNGLSVLWIVYRGPVDVAFDPPGYQPAKVDASDAKKSGKTSTTARFVRPGTYVLRAIAADGLAMTPADVAVSVTGTKSNQ